MRSTAFLRLAARVGAYNGALTARIAKERRAAPAAGKGARRAVVNRPLYERGSAMTNNARAADSAPPATAEAIASLNAQLGGGWFSHRTVPADGAPAAGGETG